MAIAPGEDESGQGQRRQHAEVTEPSADTQWPRPLGVALLRFGVDHLGGVEQQHDLAPRQPQPCRGLAGDEVQRARRPVARHVSRRQRASERVLGEFGGVGPLILRRPAPEPQRRVGAVGLRVVADEEVWAELRRREVEAAADGVVADGHGEQDDGQARDEYRGVQGPAQAGHYDPFSRLWCRCSVRLQPDLWDHRPHENDPDEHQRVLARQRHAAHGQTECEPTGAVRTVDQSPGQPERQRDEEQVEHRLLDERIEEDGRRVEGEHESRDGAHSGREEAEAGQPEQRARRGTDDRLQHPQRGQAVAEHGVDHADEVRIERRLIEDL